jgi:uncharacterized protein YciI
MRWVVIFEDKPQMLAVRSQREAQHLEYLREHSEEILLAGGLREAPGAPFVGGLWVLEVSSRERAVELVERDPYFAPPHRKYKLLTWGKALAEQQVVL